MFGACLRPATVGEGERKGVAYISEARENHAIMGDELLMGRGEKRAILDTNCWQKKEGGKDAITSGWLGKKRLHKVEIKKVWRSFSEGVQFSRKRKKKRKRRRRISKSKFIRERKKGGKKGGLGISWPDFFREKSEWKGAIVSRKSNQKRRGRA